MLRKSSGIAAGSIHDHYYGNLSDRQTLLDCMINANMMAFNEKTFYHSISFNRFCRAYR